MVDYLNPPPQRMPEEASQPLRMIFVKTIADPDPEEGEDAYPPEEDEPNVYMCRILKNVRYTKEAGAQVLDYDETTKTDHVCNLCDGSYLEEGSVVAAFTANAELWTMDAVRQREFLVCCHYRAATTTGDTGTVSRLKPSDGSVMWTVDLGTDPASGRERWAYSVAVDSTGNTYAAWKLRGDFSGGWPVAPVADDEPVGGVAKISKTGEIVDTVTFAFGHPTGQAAVSTIGSLPRIAIDPNDDNRIYVGLTLTADNHLIHRLDQNLAIQASHTLNPAAVASGPCWSLAVDSAGDVYASFPVSAPAIDSLLKLNPSLVVTESMDEQPDPGTAPGLFIDENNNKLRHGSRPDGGVAATHSVVMGPPSPLDNGDPYDFEYYLDEFAFDVSGNWKTPPEIDPTHYRGAVCDGTRFILGCVNAPIWERTGTLPDVRPSVFAISREGVGLYCVRTNDVSGLAADTTFGVQSETYELALDQHSGGLYAAGNSRARGTLPAADEWQTYAPVVKLDKATGAGVWHASLFEFAEGTGPVNNVAWGVAARTIRG